MLKREDKYVIGIGISETGGMTGILEQLYWESENRRKDKNRKCLKGVASLPTNDLVPPTRRTRKYHSMANPPTTGTYLYKCSFFPKTIRDCNSVAGPEVIKLFSCSTQLSMNFFLLINVKMPTVVGILTFMSGKNSSLGLSELKKADFFYIFILMSI